MRMLNENLRELPMSPMAFGLLTFAILSLLLHLTLRIDRD
jgi:hypothetical protein